MEAEVPPAFNDLIDVAVTRIGGVDKTVASGGSTVHRSRGICATHNANMSAGSAVLCCGSKVARFRYVRPEQGNILRRCDACRRISCDPRRCGRASAGRLDLKLPKTDRLQALRQVKTDNNLKTIPVVALKLDLQLQTWRETLCG
jgi:hypothetical protein